MRNSDRIHELAKERALPFEEWRALFETWDEEDRMLAARLARAAADSCYGKAVYVRGLIEYSNICRNNCLYCGLRRDNARCRRFRLSPEDIMDSARAGYDFGLRTFVLQGGEDPGFGAGSMAPVVRRLKEQFPDCAVTLSMGECGYGDYKSLREAGADRYLLRHETATEMHYMKLHPPEMSWRNRVKCLEWLAELGYQVGCGFMVGSPFQTAEDLAREMEFARAMHPAMVGIGPFIPHRDTPFASMPAGAPQLSLFCLSLLRLQQPDLLMPATTALATLLPDGYEQGILAGANVIMPNISPEMARSRYVLYDNMAVSAPGTAIMESPLRKRMEAIGYSLEIGRGDHKTADR